MRGEEGVRGGGVGGGQTGVEVDTLHVEITARTVHQSSTGVADLQHRPCQRHWGEMTSSLSQLVCIVEGYNGSTDITTQEKFHPFFQSFQD